MEKDMSRHGNCRHHGDQNHLSRLRLSPFKNHEERYHRIYDYEKAGHHVAGTAETHGADRDGRRHKNEDTKSCCGGSLSPGFKLYFSVARSAHAATSSHVIPSGNHLLAILLAEVV